MTRSTDITLSWTDPDTGQPQQKTHQAPIVLGRAAIALPTAVAGYPAAQIVLERSNISRYHALLDWQDDQLRIIDQNSSNGLSVNGQPVKDCALQSGDRLQIGPYQIQVTYVPAIQQAAAALPAPNRSADAPTIVRRVRSSSSLLQAEQLNPDDLRTQRLPVKEVDYATIGGGLGSYIWADYLRIFGAATHQIAALGMRTAEPYLNYKRLCLNSQIPLHERLRSNSDSCPDNLWGWPGYALREAWQDTQKGQLSSALRYLWQVFAEPTLAETYTPRAGNVFDSIDREAQRISWEKIWRYGRCKSIRQTTDGRYAIAYAQSEDQSDPAFLIAPYVLLATGYPKIQFLPDLQAYREEYRDFDTVVNAYEQHDHVYQKLAQSGGTVVLRGRGIVASRIIQRLHEMRQQTQRPIKVLHLMRSPKTQGNRFRGASRAVANHFEFQPFNWPKACWGGDLRDVLENASATQRDEFIKVWGGTTTADRRDWQQITRQALVQGWYSIVFGAVVNVTPHPQGGTVTRIREQNVGDREVQADFIIDATGLDAEVKYSQLLDDLVSHYDLPLNSRGRLAVTNDFELDALRQPRGRVYAIGAIAFGGPYAAVDSFLGLQYAALRVVDHLAAGNAPGIRPLNGLASFNQWLKWATNQPPNPR